MYTELNSRAFLPSFQIRTVHVINYISTIFLGKKKKPPVKFVNLIFTEQFLPSLKQI